MKTGKPIKEELYQKFIHLHPRIVHPSLKVKRAIIWHNEEVRTYEPAFSLLEPFRMFVWRR